MSFNPRPLFLCKELQRPNHLAAMDRPTNLIWLDKNENLDTFYLQELQNILLSMSVKSISSYPDSSILYQKLSEWLSVSPDSLLLTAGSDGVIRQAFEAFVAPGDIVIHTSPTFAMYAVYCKMFGAVAHKLEYRPSKNGPILELDEILESIGRLKPAMLCLPNPDSPTGTVLLPQALLKILRKCEEYGILMLLDEAYHPFYNWSAVPWILESENVIIARTFAKAWGVAGLRLGYAVGDPKTIRRMQQMRPMYESGAFSIDFMTRLLDKKLSMESSVERINAGKLYFQNEMAGIGMEVLQTHGNFVHINFGEYGETISKYLSDKVLYRPSFDHCSLAGFSRFTSAPIEIMHIVSKFIRDAIK